MPQPVRSNFPIVPFLLVLLASCLLSGCIHLDQSLHVRPDGSLSVLYHYSIAEDLLATMLSGREAVGALQQARPEQATTSGAADWFTSEAAVRRHFSGPHLDVRRYRRFRHAGRLHVELEVHSDDAIRSINSGAFGAFSLQRSEAGGIELRAALPQPAAEGAPNAHAAARLRAFCTDLQLQLTVITPGDILASTGESKGTRRVVWTFAPDADGEWPLDTPEVAVRFDSESLSRRLPPPGTPPAPNSEP